MRLFTVDGRRWTVDGRRRRLPVNGRFYCFGVVLAALFLLFPVLPLAAQTGDDVFPPKPDPAVYVHDYSGWLSAGEKAMLEDKLRRYNDSTSTQVVVMIRPDIGDYDKASYAFELGNRWGIGRKSKNNGVVMLIKSEPPDRGIFIATGYGTEGALPDITAGRIIRNTMAPFFRQQQYYQGIDAGLNEIIRALAGEFKSEPEDRKDGGGGWIFLLIFVLVVLFFVILVV
ncbi:MAG: TPM domain-containing protein, partial [Thermoanaerobaculia bacterium]|nr:TPM domain-containing protein [Thermoanaerobaculia bacterium]